MTRSELPRVRLLIGPGTLHSRGANRMDFTRYSRSGNPRMTGEELLETLPELVAIARVEVDEGNPHEVATLDDLRRLAVRVNALLARQDLHGLVLVQGTNTLEETAWFLSLTARSAKPVVVTGAQRPYTALGADGPVNLIDAIRVAVTPGSTGKGAVVVTNGEINAAREVTKTSTYRLQTFRSRDMGLLGYADADRVLYYREPVRRRGAGSEFEIEGVAAMPPVEILYVYTGSRPGCAEAALGLGARGIVVAGSGAGSTGNLAQELAAIAASGRAVVVQSSRVGEGRVVPNNNWSEPGMVVADNLSPQKSAVLLSLALTRTTDPREVQRMFDQY
ncbi:MAG: asparaginase [Burkholderiales bacterium]|nr:asparaginase [Burkholderiales bacterium]